MEKLTEEQIKQIKDNFKKRKIWLTDFKFECYMEKIFSFSCYKLNYNMEINFISEDWVGQEMSAGEIASLEDLRYLDYGIYKNEGMGDEGHIEQNVKIDGKIYSILNQK